MVTFISENEKGDVMQSVNVLARARPSAAEAHAKPLPLSAEPVPLWPPVLFSPLTGSDGYNPFLTTGEILESGLDSDPARAPVRRSVIGKRYLFLTAVWHWDSPCLAWTS